MNWTEILAKAGIPESPGREEAIRDAIALSAEKKLTAVNKSGKGKKKR